MLGGSPGGGLAAVPTAGVRLEWGTDDDAHAVVDLDAESSAAAAASAANAVAAGSGAAGSGEGGGGDDTGGNGDDDAPDAAPPLERSSSAAEGGRCVPLHTRTQWREAALCERLSKDANRELAATVGVVCRCCSCVTVTA